MKQQNEGVSPAGQAGAQAKAIHNVEDLLSRIIESRTVPQRFQTWAKELLVELYDAGFYDSAAP